MKIRVNKYMPFKEYSAINLFGVLYTRQPKESVSQRTIRHEKIHTAQMKEMWYIFFYIWYVIEWTIRFFLYGLNSHKAYMEISFEREAYTNEDDLNYLKTRKIFS